MVIERGKFSVSTARLTALRASHIVADSEKRRLIFWFAVYVVAELPRSPTGKVLKRELAAQLP